MNKTISPKKRIQIGLFSIFFLFFLIWALLAANGKKIGILHLFTKEPEIVVVQTGGIRIINKDLVSDMKAKLNDKNVEIKENRIENLEPGTYKLEIILEGFDSWIKTVRIDPGIITEINPLPFPSNFNLEEKLTENVNIDKVFYSEYGDYVYYVVTKAPKGIDNGIFMFPLSKIQSIFNTNANTPVKIANLVTPVKEYIEKENFEIIPSSDNRKIILKSENMDHLILNIDQPFLALENNKYISIENLLGYSPQEITWFKGSSSIILRHNNLLAELILDSGKVVLISYEPDIKPVYSVNGDVLIFYSNSTEDIMIYKNEIKDKIVLENRDLPTSIEQIILDKNTGNYLVIRSDNDYYFLSIADSYINLIDSNINPLEFSKDGTCLVYEKDGSLFSYVTKEIKPKNDFDIKKNLILESYNNEDTDIKINSNSSHLMIFKENTLVVKDLTGENSKIILESDNLIENSFYMTSDNKEMILLMLIQAQTESIEEIKTLYSINLVPSK